MTQEQSRLPSQPRQTSRSRLLTGPLAACRSALGGCSDALCPTCSTGRIRTSQITEGLQTPKYSGRSTIGMYFLFTSGYLLIYLFFKMYFENQLKTATVLLNLTILWVKDSGRAGLDDLGFHVALTEAIHRVRLVLNLSGEFKMALPVSRVPRHSCLEGWLLLAFSLSGVSRFPPVHARSLLVAVWPVSVVSPARRTFCTRQETASLVGPEMDSVISTKFYRSKQ